MIDEQSLVNNLGRLERRISELEASSASHTERILKSEHRIEYDTMAISWGEELRDSIKLNVKEIAELRKEILGWDEIDRNYNEQLNELKEVLRVIIPTIQSFSVHYKNELLEKLDSGGEKTVNPCIKCVERDICINKGELYKKASGCDYKGMITGEQQIAMEQEQGEKPPEPILVKREDLQWLFKELENWIHEYMDGLPKALKRALKPVELLKEKYNL